MVVENLSNILKKISGFFFIFLIFVSCSNPKDSGVSAKRFDPSGEPVQKELKRIKVLRKVSYDGIDFIVSTKYRYEITALLKSSEKYYLGWESEFSPVDFCLVWGKLSEKYIDKTIKYEQSSRWYFYRYDGDCQASSEYISSHSSNNHIIPATENLKNLLTSRLTNKIIYLKGYLVNIDGNKNGAKYWWRSSLSREDSGEGACEVFYVTRAEVNNRIYK
ncbi:MAG TPA: hypothetical protein PKY81_10190 [bacterium]|nr:hypothetical protein [bacterium]